MDESTVSPAVSSVVSSKDESESVELDDELLWELVVSIDEESDSVLLDDELLWELVVSNDEESDSVPLDDELLWELEVSPIEVVAAESLTTGGRATLGLAAMLILAIEEAAAESFTALLTTALSDGAGDPGWV